MRFNLCILLGVLWASTACKGAYNTPERPEAEVRAELAQACEKATTAGKYVLLEFSAPWCGDCRRLAALKKEAPLSQALRELPNVVVNIGDFDKHESLLRSFDVHAVAHWELLSTDDCQAPVEEWSRVKHRTVEPSTGDQPVTAADLAAWLKAQ